MRSIIILAIVSVAMVQKSRSEALKRRFSVLLVMMFCATVVVAGPASATPSGIVNGNHFGEYRNQDNGQHVGTGVGAGKFDNKRRGLR
jgi:hypothetical protein